MNSQPPGAVGKQPRPQPGRVYAFLVIALATLVLGLGVGPPAGAATDAAAPAGLATPTHPPDAWTKPQLAIRMGVALLLGTVGGWLAGRTAKRGPESVPVDPKLVEQATELPVVGTLFPAPRPATSASSFRWIIFPAELVLMLAVMLSFHAAVTQPTFAQRFSQNPFSAYAQSVHDWRDWIGSTLQR